MMKLSIEDIIGKLKDPQSKEHLILDDPMVDRFYLRPVNINIVDAGKMAEWRREAFESFFTWVKPTGSNLLEWLKRYESDMGDIIFILNGEDSVFAGQMSIYNINYDKKSAEFGRVMRGYGKAPKGIMTIAAKRLLGWAYQDLKLEYIYLHVFANSKKAISLYVRLGFKVEETLLYKKILNDEKVVRWVGFSEQDHLSNDSEYRKIYKMKLDKKLFANMQNEKRER